MYLRRLHDIPDTGIDNRLSNAAETNTATHSFIANDKTSVDNDVRR